MKMNSYLPVLFLLVLFTGCRNTEKYPGRTEAESRIDALSFEKEVNGKKSGLYRLENSGGMTVILTNTGASIVQVIVPDKNGHFDDIALGYKTLAEYQENPMYNGCVVGRYANRIAFGKFNLNGKDYQLSINNGKNSLHGGPAGFHVAFWDAEEIENGVRFSYTSADMEEGYPGEVVAHVTYRLNDDNELSLEYEAESQDSTFINLTNHTYWNLEGEAAGEIYDHELMIASSSITPVDSGLIPDGSFMDVEGTPFDFREFHKIGERIHDEHPQILLGGGYDHNFVLSAEAANELHEAAVLRSPKSGRFIEIRTTEPGIQFYSGNFMDGSLTGKNGNIYKFRHAVALETQHFPDSPNQPSFPSTLLVPDKKFSSTTVFRFGVRE